MLVRERGGRCPNKSGGGEVVGNFFGKIGGRNGYSGPKSMCYF